MTNAVAIYNNFDDLQRAALALEASGYFSNDVKSKAQAIVKVMAGAELGLPPFASMSGIHIIQGKPTMGANVMATLIKNDPRYNYRVTKLDDTVCEIQFFEDGQKCGVSEFTIDDAQKAGTKNLAKFPKNMLFARAISNGAKWFTPGIFGGSPIYTPEELGADVNGDGEIIDVTPDEPMETVVEAVVEVEQPATNGNGYGARPFPPETLKRIFDKKVANDGSDYASKSQAQWAAASLAVITLDDNERYDLTEFLLGKRSVKDLTALQTSAIIDWIEYKKGDDGEWTFNEDARQEAALVLKQIGDE